MSENTLTFRHYQAADREECLAIFKSNSPQYFTKAEIDDFGKWLDGFVSERPIEERIYHFHYNVAVLETRIIGCGGFVFDSVNNEVRMAWGFIANDAHRRGLGRKLVEHRLHKIRETYPQATVLLDTTQHTYRFYERMGFVTTKITENYYETGMHRYDMQLEVEASDDKQIL